MEKIWMSKCCIMLFLMLMEQPAPKNITSSENGPLIDQNIIVCYSMVMSKNSTLEESPRKEAVQIMQKPEHT